MNNRIALPDLQIQLLGKFEIRGRDDLIINLAYDKGRALLAYLACQPEISKPRNQLAQLFWPDLPREAGLTNLRLVLHDIRQKLASQAGITDLLLTSRTHLGFNKRYLAQIDFHRLHEFKMDTAQATEQRQISEMQSIVHHYQGDMLADLNLENCDEFDEWLGIKREASLRKVLSVLEPLCEFYQQQGNYQQALTLANRYSELDPWNEAGHRLIMRLHMACQQTAAALAHFDYCKRILMQELGVAPAKATEQLAETIRNGQFSLDTAEHEFSRLERRQVTVLCCDFHARPELDPEQQWEQLLTPRAACIALLKEATAHIAEHQGSCLLAYFGYPQAQEFAARNAIETALRILDLNFPDCRFSLGINTGAILIESKQAIPEPIGITSELALRLRLIAEPGELVISRQTQLLTQGYFNYEDLGEQHLRGLPQAIHVYRIKARNQARDRLQASVTLSPYIGRETELSLLQQAWQTCLAGKFRVIAIQAEAGVGKSRLLHEFLRTIPDQEMNFLVLRGLPEHQHSSYAPFIHLLEQQLGWHEHTEIQQKWQQLSEYARLLSTNSDDAAIESSLTLASLMQIPVPPGHTEYASSPQKLRQGVIELALNRIRMLSADAALLLFLEDLHWFDASSLEIIQQLLLQADLSLLLITASRDSLPPAFTQNATTLASNLQTIQLAPLDQAETSKLIQQVNPALTPELVTQIYQQSDGIPLFAEEISKFYASGMTVPQTLQDLLASKLEGLGEARFLAQTAATLGREFEVGLLERCFLGTPLNIPASLALLCQAEIIVASRPHHFRFKHALIRDAAYHTQSKLSQRQSHVQIAGVLEQTAVETGNLHAEVLAYHFEQAQHYEKAIGYWFDAGMANLKLFANQEALDHFEHALKLCSELRELEQINSWRLRLLLQIFTCQRTLYGYGSELANASLDKAIQLSDQQSDHPYLFQAIWNIWSSSSTRTGYQSSLVWAQRLLQLAEQHQDPVQLEQAWYTLCNTLMWLGRFTEARHYAEKLMANYQPEHDAVHRQLFGENPYINAGAHLSWILWFLGDIDQAFQLSTDIIAAAENLNHPYSLCFALCFASVLQRWAGSAQAAHELAERGIQLSTQHGFALWQAACVMVHGWAGSCLGIEGALAQLHGSIDAMRAVMGGVAIGFLTPQADALLRQADYARATLVLQEALGLSQHISDGHATVELLRLQALCYAQHPAQSQQASALLEQAREFAIAQENHALGLRVALNQMQMMQHTAQADIYAQQLKQAMQKLRCQRQPSPDLQLADELLQRYQA